VQAAAAYSENPTAVHLRAMNMLYEAIKEGGSMVIVPSSAVETMGLGGTLATVQWRKRREAATRINGENDMSWSGSSRIFWQRSKVALLTMVSGFLVVVSSTGQEMREGVSVQLAASKSAEAMPLADRERAIIVAITRDDEVFVGAKSVAINELTAQLTSQLASTVRKTLYIKADARTPYANVVKVFGAARSAGVEEAALLTAQQGSTNEQGMVSPQGLRVLLSGPAAGAGAVAVQVMKSGMGAPDVEIDKEKVSWSDLQSRLTQVVQKRGEKLVVLQADGELPFADVAHVIDASRSMGARVVVGPRT
jgi:biopolymer transport protein ExbD